ncbi:unnamed protein product, partial [Mesorhabditis spiculigera]
MRIKKKGTTGAVTNYVSRTKAIKKLQLSLKDFRRLCILKGIHPHEPLHKKTVNKGSNESKVWYYVKDINFLMQEPIINKFREQKIFLRKLNHYKAKQEDDKVKKLFENRPIYSLDIIVKERYPTFGSALRDLDDALCLGFLFARLPHTKLIRSETISECKRLTTEFMHYVIESHSLTNTFISLKGIYYQAIICGEKITWIVPHERGFETAHHVDFSLMAVFAEFYVAMMGFVNYRLYQMLGLYYPPTIQSPKAAMETNAEEDLDKVYSLCRPIARKEEPGNDEEDEILDGDDEDDSVSRLKEAKRIRTLFQGCTFFINRECPKEAIALVVRNCGGKATWENAPVELTGITHHIVDRPMTNVDVNRIYVQPQWVFDSLNARRKLPTKPYLPGETLPPHFSPFVKERPGDYIPIERIEELRSLGEDVDNLTIQPQASGATAAKPKAKAEPKEKKMEVVSGKMHKKNKQQVINQKGEDKKMRELMLKKKHVRVYDKLTKGIKRRRGEASKLADKRRRLESTAK